MSPRITRSHIAPAVSAAARSISTPTTVHPCSRRARDICPEPQPNSKTRLFSPTSRRMLGSALSVRLSVSLDGERVRKFPSRLAGSCPFGEFIAIASLEFVLEHAVLNRIQVSRGSHEETSIRRYRPDQPDCSRNAATPGRRPGGRVRHGQPAWTWTTFSRLPEDGPTAQGRQPFAAVLR